MSTNEISSLFGLQFNIVELTTVDAGDFSIGLADGNRIGAIFNCFDSNVVSLFFGMFIDQLVTIFHKQLIGIGRIFLIA